MIMVRQPSFWLIRAPEVHVVRDRQRERERRERGGREEERETERREREKGQNLPLSGNNQQPNDPAARNLSALLP